METIKLSVNNFWFKYWNFISFYPDAPYRPRDTCSLKRGLIWKTLVCIVLLPAAIAFALVRKYAKMDSELYNDSVIYFIMGMVQCAGFLMLVVIPSFPVPLAFILGPLVLFIVGGSILFLIFGAIELHCMYRKAFPKKYVYKEKKPSIIKTLYLGWKDKLCSKIEYLDAQGNIIPAPKNYYGEPYM